MMFLTVCNRNGRRGFAEISSCFFEYLRIPTADGQERLPGRQPASMSVTLRPRSVAMRPSGEWNTICLEMLCIDIIIYEMRCRA